MNKENSNKKRRNIWICMIAAVVCVCIAVVCILNFGGSNSYVLAAAVYPDDVDRSEAVTEAVFYSDDFKDYLKSTLPEMLDTSDGENAVYSPLNLYMALVMLSEITEGESRQQVLDLLGASDEESALDSAGALWRASYRDESELTCLPANSLWLRNGETGYDQETIDLLAKELYCSVFSGETGTEAYNKALRDWINKETKDLLKESADKLEMDANTVMTLVSTIYYKANWQSEFSAEGTETATFHGSSSDTECDFMHSYNSGVYYAGENFGAVTLALEGGDNMWLILPDEDSSAENVINSEDLYDMLCDGQEWENSKIAMIDLKIPKFDIMAETDLEESLPELGITDVFDPMVSDFSPIIDDSSDICVSDATHCARVKIDEEGIEAAAYTEIEINDTAMRPEDEEIEFILDRPFIFVITGADGTALFAGVVNNME